MKVFLQGQKLLGGFVLVHTGGRVAEPKERTRWLLVKRQDQYADPSWDIEDPKLDRSALTGRTLPAKQRAA